jgi:hypothetical protein
MRAAGPLRCPANGAVPGSRQSGLPDSESRHPRGSVSADDDGSDAVYGIGATYESTEQWAIRGEFDRYELDKTDADTIWIGAVFSFLAHAGAQGGLPALGPQPCNLPAPA